jgi:hypothetical protein
VLQPNEEGRVEISLDTRRFSGRRTWSLVLEMNDGKKMVTRFTITANALDDPES